MLAEVIKPNDFNPDETIHKQQHPRSGVFRSSSKTLTDALQEHNERKTLTRQVAKQ